MTTLMKPYTYNGTRYLVSFVLSIAVDITFFYTLLNKGIGWNTAQVYSFLAEAFVISLLWLSWPPADAPVQGFGRRILGYITIQLLALFFRSGVLAALVESSGLSPQTAIIPAAMALSIVFLLGVHFWLFQHKNGENKQKEWSKSLTIAIIVYAISLRVIYSWTFELLHEEAYYWNYAQHLDIGYLDHPPMVGWLIWIFTTLLGNTEFTVRFGALVCWIVTAYYFYKLTYEVCGPTAAFRAFFLAAVLPVFFGTGLVITPDAPLMACWAGALYYLYRAVIKERRWSWLGVGVFMGLGLLSKYTIALLGLSLVIFLLIDRKSKKWFIRPQPYLGLILTIALFSPVILWNARQDWASFGFQSTGRLAGDFDFALPELLGSALLLLTPTGFLAAIAVVISKKVILPDAATSKKDRSYRLLLITTVLPFSIFFFFSLFRLSKLNWTAPIWLGVLPYIATFMKPGRFSFIRKFPRYIVSAWPATIVFMLLIYGVIFHYTVLGLPGVPYPSALFGIGIPDFVRQVASIEEDFERQYGEKPFIICMDTDRLAGWIAFYRTKMTGSENESQITEFIQNTTGGHLFEKDSHMYRFWHPVETYDKERPLLIIATSREYLQKDQLLARVNPTSDIKERVLRKYGKPTTSFFYQFAKLRSVKALL